MTARIRLLINGLLVLALIGAGFLIVLGSREVATAAVWGRLLIGIGVGGVTAVGVMFFLPLELRANLTLTGVAVLLTLWVASWILHEPRLSPGEQRQRDYEAVARNAGVPFDTRTPRQVIRELRGGGVDGATPLSAWVFFSEDPEVRSDAWAADPGADGEPAIVPLGGPSRTTTVSCNEQGEYLIVDSDRYGYNNPDDAYAASSPVLILGDSFAFGFCVRPGRDIGGQLRDRDVGVVNLGYPGHGPLIELAQLREYGPVLEPSVILWLFYNGNDLVNLTGEYELPALRRYLDPRHHENLPARQAEIDALWTSYLDRAMKRDSRPSPSLRDILLLQPLRDRLVGRVAAAPGRPRARIERFNEALDAMIAEAETLDAPLYFVFLPTYSQFDEEDGDRELEARDAVLAAVRARGLPIIDFETRLRETGDPLQYYPFRSHGHYTEEAYGLLVDQILQRLRQDGVQVPASAAPSRTAAPSP